MERTAQEIPGMIEPVEQELLLDLASSVELGRDDIVCEVGSYLGRSAWCLAQGLTQNRRLSLEGRSRAVLHAHDVFACQEGGALAAYLLQDVKRAGVEALLRVADGRVDFHRVFRHHLGDFPAGLVQSHQAELSAMRHPGGKIALMHVDAPKWYQEYRALLVEFGPHLKSDAYLILQDHFYHWSAELVAAAEFFIQRGVFEPLETAATSLLVRVKAPIDEGRLRELDEAMAAGTIERLIEQSIARYLSFEVDRPEQFVARLYLAGLQHAFERGAHEQAGRWWLAVNQRYGGADVGPVAGDMADLLRYGLSLRRIYLDDTRGALDR